MGFAALYPSYALVSVLTLKGYPEHARVDLRSSGRYRLPSYGKRRRKNAQIHERQSADKNRPEGGNGQMQEGNHSQVSRCMLALERTVLICVHHQHDLGSERTDEINITCISPHLAHAAYPLTTGCYLTPPPHSPRRSSAVCSPSPAPEPETSPYSSLAPWRYPPAGPRRRFRRRRLRLRGRGR